LTKSQYVFFKYLSDRHRKTLMGTESNRCRSTKDIQIFCHS